MEIRYEFVRLGSLLTHEQKVSKVKTLAISHFTVTCVELFLSFLCYDWNSLSEICVFCLSTVLGARRVMMAVNELVFLKSKAFLVSPLILRYENRKHVARVLPLLDSGLLFYLMLLVLIQHKSLRTDENMLSLCAYLITPLLPFLIWKLHILETEVYDQILNADTYEIRVTPVS